MRKIVLSVLMLLMLTPSLACAMPVCANQAAEVVGAPCAGHMMSGHAVSSHTGHGQIKKENAGKSEIKLIKDCMKLDLQVSDGPALKKPDTAQGSLDVFAEAAIARPIWVIRDVSGIRGPPPDWPALSQAQPDILFTTQRLRI